MYIPSVLKALAKKKSTTIASVMTVAVIICLLISITALMNTFTGAVYLPFKSVDADMMLQKAANSSNSTSGIKLPFGKGMFDDKEIGQIAGLDHVTALSKTLVVWDFGRSTFLSIKGVEPDSFIGEKLKSWVSNGTFLSGEGQAAVESHYAKFNHLKVGDSLSIGGSTYKIVGIIKIQDGTQMASSNVFLTLPDVRKLSGIDGYNQLYIKADSLSSEDSIRAALGRLNGKILVVSGDSISASLGNVTKIYEQFSLIGMGIMFLLTLLVLFKVNAMSLLDRRKDIGIMQSVGWTKKDISLQIVLEIFLQTISGFVLGVVSSLVIITLVSPLNIAVPSFDLSGKTTTIAIPLALSPELIIGYFVFIAVISLCVSILMIRKISGMKPSENLYRL